MSLLGSARNGVTALHGKHSLLLVSFIHSLIHLFGGLLGTQDPQVPRKRGNREGDENRARGAWVAQRGEHSSTHLPSLTVTVISSLRTSSGALRSQICLHTATLQGPPVGRGPSSVSHASCSESAPCLHVSRTPASGQSSLEVLNDKGGGLSPQEPFSPGVRSGRRRAGENLRVFSP